MKAIALIPGTKNVYLTDRPSPRVASSDEVKVKVISIGICGTDREEAAGGRSTAPPGSKELVIGHEMFGRVVEVGPDVKTVNIGDYGLFSVRRPCGICFPCSVNRADMCLSGNYKERGIKELDGYQAEYVLDKEQYFIKIPPEIRSIGVLTEPTSIGIKAIEESIAIQSVRLPMERNDEDWIKGKRCLIAGLGPIGLLVGLDLALRGAVIYGLDIVEPASYRVKWLEHIGGTYIYGKKTNTEDIDDKFGAMDLIFEATGAPKLEFNLLDALGYNGIYVITGIPGGDKTIEIQGAELIRRLVLKNQVMIGSVNAAPKHFAGAVDTLGKAYDKWGDHVEKLITHRFPVNDFKMPLQSHLSDEIKSVIEWGESD